MGLFSLLLRGFKQERLKLKLIQFNTILFTFKLIVTSYVIFQFILTYGFIAAQVATKDIFFQCSMRRNMSSKTSFVNCFIGTLGTLMHFHVLHIFVSGFVNLQVGFRVRLKPTFIAF